MQAPNGYRIMTVCWEDTYPAYSYVTVKVAIPIEQFTDHMKEYADNNWDWELSKNFYDESLRMVQALRFDETTQTWENW